MKTKMKIMILALIALGTIEAHAQAQKQEEVKVDLFTQVSMTQDFVSSMLNQLSTSSVDRMNQSKDYSEAGPELQSRIKGKLENFRAAIKMIFSGSFSQMIQEYNQVVQDKNLAADKLAARKSALFDSITQLAKAVQSSYQAQIKDLFMIEKSIYVQKISLIKRGDWPNDDEKTDFNDVYFANNKRIRLKVEDVIYFNNKYVQNIIRTQLKNIILDQCSTQTCYSNLFNDYASYFSQIQNFVNKPVEITLADSRKITIPALRDGAIVAIIESMNAFVFESDYTNLPFSN